MVIGLGRVGFIFDRTFVCTLQNVSTGLVVVSNSTEWAERELRLILIHFYTLYLPEKKASRVSDFLGFGTSGQHFAILVVSSGPSGQSISSSTTAYIQCISVTGVQEIVCKLHHF